MVGRKFPRRPPEGRPLFCVPSSPRCRDADKTYTVKILGGSFPIDEGTTQVGPFPLYCCGDKDCFPAACDQLVGTVYGWLYVPTGNLFDAEQGATAKGDWRCVRDFEGVGEVALSKQQAANLQDRHGRDGHAVPAAHDGKLSAGGGLMVSE